MRTSMQAKMFQIEGRFSPIRREYWLYLRKIGGKRRQLGAFFSACLFSVGLLGDHPGFKAAWPLKEQPVLSASFGEYRGRRFHMGLDLSTGGVEGRKVFPVADGVVFKVRYQARGYGRSVYVRHPGGYISVYAHLAQFGKKIRNETGDVRGYFKAKNVQIPISTSDIIAFTGESGSGLPHLHFEIRDSKNQPMDPLNFGLSTANHAKEFISIKAIRLVPLTTESRVNGRFFPQEFTDFSKPIRAHGRIGFDICGYVSFRNGNRLGFRELSLSVNTVGHAVWKPLALSYDKNRQAGILFNRYYSGFSPTRYVYSFHFQKSPKIPGLAMLQPVIVTGKTEIQVQARGLKKSLTLDLVLDPSAKLLPVAEAKFFPDPSGFPMWNGKVKFMAHGLKTAEIRTLAPGTSLKSTLLPTHTLALARLPEKPETRFAIESWHVESTLGNLLMAVGEKPPSPKQGLAAQSNVLSFENPGASISMLVVAWDMPKDTLKKWQLGLYEWSVNKKKWKFNQPLQKGKARFQIPFSSKICVFRDDRKPSIGDIRKHRYFDGTKKVIPLRDRESGIDWNRVEVTSGGQKVGFDSDPDRGWIILPVLPGTPFKVVVLDRAGNMMTRIFTK